MRSLLRGRAKSISRSAKVRRSSPTTPFEADVLVDVTGSGRVRRERGLRSFQAREGRHPADAEMDATIGPILQVYAKHGVIFSACDGDEPGLQINPYRWVKGLGAAGWLASRDYRIRIGIPPRRKVSPKSGSRIRPWSPASPMARRSASNCIVANATGFKVQSRGMSRATKRMS